MTDIEPYRSFDERTLAEPDPAPPSAADYTEWVPALRAAAELARELAGTEFVPTPLRDRPAAVAAAILAGREMHLGPMASLQHVHVIEGRPSLSAEMARALILSHGHQLRFREMSSSRCVLAGRRRGEDGWTQVEFSMEDARRAGIAQRPQYRRYPRRMLAARATGELARLIFTDCLAGMSYVSEEASEAGDDSEPETSSRRRTARRRTPAGSNAVTDTRHGVTPEPETRHGVTPEDGPALPGEDEDAADAGDGEDEDGTHPGPVERWHEQVSRAQLDRIHATYTTAGVTERDEKLRIARAIVGRPELASSTELSRHEGAVLIDTLTTVTRNAGEDAAEALVQLAAEAEAQAAAAEYASDDTREA